MNEKVEDNEDNYLLSIAIYVSETHTQHPDPNFLVSNPEELDAFLKSIKIDWHAIATTLNTNRNKVYHWYYETHLRHMSNERITKQDKQEMAELIVEAIQNREILEPNFEQVLRQKVFKNRQIHRSDFSMAFNNIVRTKAIKQLLENCHLQLPNRRSLVNSRSISPSHIYCEVPSKEDFNFQSLKIPKIDFTSLESSLEASHEEEDLQQYEFNALPPLTTSAQPIYNCITSPQVEESRFELEPPLEDDSFNMDLISNEEDFPFEILGERLLPYEK